MIDPTTRARWPRSVADVVAGLDVAAELSRPIPSGFEPLDTALEGGFRTRELAIVGGPPGIGKTSVALQWARHAATKGRAAVFVCYEHDEASLLGRLLAQEIGELSERDSPGSHYTRAAVRAVTRGEAVFEDELSSDLLLRSAYSRLDEFAHRLWLYRASGVTTTVKELEAIADDFGPGTVLFIDYLQKIPGNQSPKEVDRIIRLAESLKELALDRDIAVVAIVAGSSAALAVRRLRLQHLRGAAGLAYEADVVLMLNEKALAVSKAHSAYDGVRAQEFAHQVVISIDKNRGGPAPVDLEFTKDLAHFRLEPQGDVVDDRLVDNLLYPE
jgi:replicative DNA helicase